MNTLPSQVFQAVVNGNEREEEIIAYLFGSKDCEEVKRVKPTLNRLINQGFIYEGRFRDCTGTDFKYYSRVDTGGCNCDDCDPYGVDDLAPTHPEDEPDDLTAEEKGVVEVGTSSLDDTINWLMSLRGDQSTDVAEADSEDAQGKPPLVIEECEVVDGTTGLPRSHPFWTGEPEVITREQSEALVKAIAGGAPTATEPHVMVPVADQLFANYPRYKRVPSFPVSVDQDPWSGQNIQDAEVAWEKWWQENTDFPTGAKMLPYPVPEFLHEMLHPYGRMAHDEAYFLRAMKDLWGIELGKGITMAQTRSACIGIMQMKFRPAAFLETINPNLKDPVKYLKTLVTSKGGEWHDDPTTPRPVTVPQYPFGLPRADQNPKVVGALQPPANLNQMLTTFGLEALTHQGGMSSTHLTELRKHRDPKREKAYQTKVKGWEQRGRTDSLPQPGRRPARVLEPVS